MPPSRVTTIPPAARAQVRRLLLGLAPAGRNRDALAAGIADARRSWSCPGRPRIESKRDKSTHDQRDAARDLLAARPGERRATTCARTGESIQCRRADPGRTDIRRASPPWLKASSIRGDEAGPARGHRQARCRPRPPASDRRSKVTSSMMAATPRSFQHPPGSCGRARQSLCWRACAAGRSPLLRLQAERVGAARQSANSCASSLGSASTGPDSTQPNAAGREARRILTETTAAHMGNTTRSFQLAPAPTRSVRSGRPDDAGNLYPARRNALPGST